MNKIKIGIFGAGRGVNLAGNLVLAGARVVALCDFNEKRLKAGLEELNDDTVTAYSSFDEFIEHDMDAVVVANYFHEHAPFVIKCFEKNLHVLCECISNGTMAEGVELIRAFEKSNSIYMLAENYPQMIFNREMKRICDGGSLGKILYAEGEYNHPVQPNDTSFNKSCIYFVEHWRNFLPRAYYVTHSLAPLMWSTGATPSKVSAQPIFEPFNDVATARHVADRAAIITTANDDGSVFRITGCATFGAHHNSYRICGLNGQIENLRGMGSKMLLRYNNWSIPEGMEETNFYEAQWNDEDEELINGAGHGGGDFIVSRMFLDCIKENRQPEHPYDIYSAVNMSSVAILAHRSILNGGIPYDIPDFKLEENRRAYENDRQTPFHGSKGEKPNIPCCSKTDYKPTQEQINQFLESLKD